MLRRRIFTILSLSVLLFLVSKYNTNHYQTFIKCLKGDRNITNENELKITTIQYNSQKNISYPSKTTRSNLDSPEITEKEVRSKTKGIFRDSKTLHKTDNAEVNDTPILKHDPWNKSKIIYENIQNNIITELKNYDFHYSGVSQLTDLVMEAGGRPQITLVISTWRSGSSFIGDLLNAMPGDFFYFEPLMFYGSKRIRNSPVKKTINTIKNLLKCRYNPNEEYFKWTNNSAQMRWNKRLWKFAENNKWLYSDTDFLSKVCKLFPFITMKLVRLRLKFVEELLQDNELNLKVILLIRDPRGVMQSRKNVEFCKLSPYCSDAKLLCKDMVSDYKATFRLMKSYPDRIVVLRFEDFVSNLKNNTHKLLKFLRRRDMPEITNFLDTHTKIETGTNYSTFRISEKVPFKWKNVLDFEYVEYIQTECLEAMKLWGYKAADNATYMKNKDFNPLDEYSIIV